MKEEIIFLQNNDRCLNRLMVVTSLHYTIRTFFLRCSKFFFRRSYSRWVFSLRTAEKAINVCKFPRLYGFEVIFTQIISRNTFCRHIKKLFSVDNWVVCPWAMSSFFLREERFIYFLALALSGTGDVHEFIQVPMVAFNSCSLPAYLLNNPYVKLSARLYMSHAP